MLAGCIQRGKTLGRYITDGLVDPYRVQERHDALVAEMQRRGYNHKSPLQEHVYSGPPGCVDIDFNLTDLTERCPECRKRIRQAA